MRSEERRLTHQGSARPVSALMLLLAGYYVRHWVAKSGVGDSWGRAVLGRWVWWIGWRAMTPVVVLVLRKPSVGQISGRGGDVDGERNEGGRKCPAELSTVGNHYVSAAGRIAVARRVDPSMRWDSVWTGLGLGR